GPRLRRPPGAPGCGRRSRTRGACGDGPARRTLRHRRRERARRATRPEPVPARPSARRRRRPSRHAPASPRAPRRLALPSGPHARPPGPHEPPAAPHSGARARTHAATTMLIHPLLAQLLEPVLLFVGQDLTRLPPRRTLILRELLQRGAQRFRLLAHLVAQLHPQLAQLFPLLGRQLLPALLHLLPTLAQRLPLFLGELAPTHPDLPFPRRHHRAPVDPEQFALLRREHLQPRLALLPPLLPLRLEPLPKLAV